MHASLEGKVSLEHQNNGLFQDYFATPAIWFLGRSRALRRGKPLEGHRNIWGYRNEQVGSKSATRSQCPSCMMLITFDSQLGRSQCPETAESRQRHSYRG
jgi:hypothetical protein